MAISTPSETIVSLEDPAALQATLGTVQLDTTTNPFTVTTSQVAVVPVSSGTGTTQNVTISTGADRSVVIAGITTDQTSTAIMDSVAIYNTDKEIYVTGIDQSTTQNIVYGSGSEYVLPPATTNTLGGVIVDGTTILVAPNGLISAAPGGYTLPTASTTVLGGVKIDGSTINISGDGVISANGVVTSVDVSGGNTGLTTTGGPVQTTGVITLGGVLNVEHGGTGQTNFASGYLTSNGTALTSVSTIPGSAISGNISGSAGGLSSTLDISSGGTGANSITAGYVKSNGSVLSSVTAIPGSDISGNISGNAGNVTGVVAIANGGTGQTTKAAAFDALAPTTTTGDITYYDGTNNVRLGIGTAGQVLTVNGGLPAWANNSGGGGGSGVSQIVAGSNITVSNSGIGIVTIDNTYTLPTSSTSVLGGVKVDGTSIVIDGSGVISAVGGGGGSGTVTSVGLSGGSTGLTVSGSPITTSGTMTLGGILAVANGGTGVSTSTGTGSVVLSTSPVLVTPNIGTPSFATLTNATGLPLSTGVTGTLPIANGGTGQTTKAAAFDALAPTTTAGDLIYFNGTDNVRLGLGTAGQVLTVSGSAPVWSSAGTGTVTSVAFTSGLGGLTVTGSPITGSGTITLNGTLAVANGGTGVTTSTGTGSVVLSTSPVLVTPNIGTPSFATLTNATGLPLSTGVTGTLPIANGGTGQTSKTAAFDALAPTTTAGDLIYFNGTDNVRLGIGSAGQVLTVSGGAPAWGAGGGGSPGGSNTQLQFNNAGSFDGISSVTWNGSKLALGSNSQVTITGGTSGQVLSTDGSGNLSWASAGGASGLVEIVTFRYAAGATANFASDSLQTQTSGVTATITDTTACTVTFSFTGKSNPPKSIMTYAQNYGTNVFAPRDITSYPTSSFSSGGTQDSPNFITSFGASNILTLTLTMANTGASGQSLKRAWLMVVFGF